jgi:hypothetical protein
LNWEEVVGGSAVFRGEVLKIYLGVKTLLGKRNEEIAKKSTGLSSQMTHVLFQLTKVTMIDCSFGTTVNGKIVVASDAMIKKVPTLWGGWLR